MVTSSKAKIVIGTNSIELEGSEEFISKYIADFREILFGETKNLPKNPAKVKTKKLVTKPIQNNDAKTAKKGKRKIKTIGVEEFNLYNTPSLEDFMKEKYPSGDSARVRIPIIAYYIQFINQQSTFTEGNIEYAYRTLNLKPRPTHLRQTIINLKNEKQLFQEGEDGVAWTLTRPGEIYVDEKLPSKDEK